MNSATINCEGFDTEKSFEFISKTGRVSNVNGNSFYISDTKDGTESLITLVSKLPLREGHVVSVLYARDPDLGASGVVGVHIHDLKETLFVEFNPFFTQFNKNEARQFFGLPPAWTVNLMIFALSFGGCFLLGYALLEGGAGGVFVGSLLALFFGLGFTKLGLILRAASETKTSHSRFHSICSNSVKAVDVNLGVPTRL